MIALDNYAVHTSQSIVAAQPHLAAANVEVRSGQTRHALGHLDDTAYIRDIHAGRAVVEALIQQKLFVRERTAGFTSVLHVSDVETWLAYRAERGSRSLLAPQIIERAREYLAQDEGEILIVTRGHAARLRRL